MAKELRSIVSCQLFILQSEGRSDHNADLLTDLTMANLDNEYGTQQRKNAYATSPGYPMAGAYGHNGSQAAALRAAQYMSTGNPMMQQAHGNGSMTALANGFGAMNLTPTQYATASRASSQAATASEYGGVPISQSPAYYMPQGQSQYLYANHMMPGSTGTQAANTMYAPAGHYMPPVSYPGYHQGMVDNSPQGQNWTPRIPSDGSSHGMPTLITPTRRDSISSNEEHLPATPYNAYGGGYQHGITVLDRSPSNVFTHSDTPSPSQFMQTYVPPHIKQQLSTSQIPLQLQLLVQQDPTIPRAIPAPSSPMKPLDRCLENKNGETNVYIRGLLPETTDEMLYTWGSRFGDIQSSKSIIDLKTNMCKG